MPPGKKILIVDDDADLLEIISTKVAQAGYTVLKAANGVEGLRVAITEHPELIILDIMMPEKTGLQMLQELRARDEWGKDVQVFMLTSMNRSKEMSEAMNYNVAKYINKANIEYDQMLSDIKLYTQ
jgi:DNA-binding response OmpR family regulator